jgi:hypothetical protein
MMTLEAMVKIGFRSYRGWDNVRTLGLLLLFDGFPNAEL